MLLECFKGSNPRIPAITYFYAIWWSLAQDLLNCLLASFVMVLAVVEKGSLFK